MNVSLAGLHRTTIAVLIALAALCFWIPRQLKLREARRQADDARTQLTRLSNHVADSTKTLESAWRDLESEKSAHHQIIADVAKAEQAFTAANPEARWAIPPASLPEWNPESPYVWLRKEMVPRFPVSAFTEDGALRPEIAYLFTLDATAQRELNPKLQKLLAEYRELEMAKAERSEEHLPGIAGRPGEKITIRVQSLPEEGARIRQQFEAALVQALGEQRTSLLIQAGGHWLESEFAQFGADTKTISVIRNPNGSYNISVQTGGSWVSTGGSEETLNRFLPPHLRPLFSELFNKTAANDSAQVPR